MIGSRSIQAWIWGMLLLASIGTANAQTVVRGVIVDAQTREPLPFVTIVFAGTTIGAITDFEGKYVVQCPAEAVCTKLVFRSLGYKAMERVVVPGTTTMINLNMQVESYELNEFVVKAGKGKRYRNRDNPAVDLAREVIAHKDSNRMESHEFIQYQEYEKLQMSLSSVSNGLKDRKLFRKYAFMFENVDTTLITGKSILPIYLQETVTDHYWRRSPDHHKSVVQGHKQVDFDGYLDNAGVSTYLNYLYDDIDIYENNIAVFTNQFLSPIADGAPTFYEFFITDTVDNGAEKLVELSFIPRNTTDFLFQGRILISLDGRYTVRNVEMGVNKNINLNWVREMHIDQRFERDPTGRFPMSHSRMRADFGISKNGNGIYGERSISRKDILVDHVLPVEFYTEETPDTLQVDERPEDYWREARQEPLTHAESKVYQNVDSLLKMPSFRRTMDIATLVLAGYKGFGPWELGPVNTFYSFNPVEGFRLRAGGRTTTQFSERISFEGYGAYGFKDEQWKYLLGSTYSLTGRSIWEFPVRSVHASYQHETKIPGQELQFVQEDFILLSFKRGVNDKWLYNDIWKLELLSEYESHFSYKLGYMNWRQWAAGGLHFTTANEPVDPDGDPLEQEVTTSEVSVELRWAPNEKFYQGKTYRIPMPNKYPVLTLRVGQGMKGVLNGEYDYTNLRMSIYKRFYFSQFGYLDLTTEGGYIFGKVPYPLLTIHRANQTYSYQLQSYNLMNFLEFVSDRYVSANFDYFLNGALFNKVPLLKKLGWREVATFKILFGRVRPENDPDNDPSLLSFPTDADGNTTTYTLDQRPYMEGSVGISNIFKLFRVDFVRRFAYLENPNVDPWGIRIRFKLDF